MILLGPVMITQEKLNEIIDLLYDAVNANGHYRVKLNASVNDLSLKAKADEALSNYLDVIQKLYGTDDYPKVYLDAFNSHEHKCVSSLSTSNRAKPAKSTLTYMVNFDAVINQLVGDFSFMGEDNKEVNITPSYTGKFVESAVLAEHTIQSDTFEFNRKALDPSFLFSRDELNPTFMMQIMSHSATLAVGSILLLAGLAACASGVAVVPGACMIGAGLMLMAGYAYANKLGFFAETTYSVDSEDADDDPSNRVTP